MAITNRQGFIDYCKRNLGWPVIQINVDDDQVSDRIDEALLYFQQFHAEGSDTTYMKHMITQFDVDQQYIDISQGSGVVTTTAGSNTVFGQETNFATDFLAGYTNITVGNETFPITSIANTHYLTVDGPFTANNTAAPYYIPEAANLITAVNRIFPLSSTFNQVNMFDLRYQMRLNDLYDFTSTSYVNYVITMQHLRTLDILFTGENPVRFNRHQNKLFIDFNWGAGTNGGGLIFPGQYIIIQATKAMDPHIFSNGWNNIWLKEYATALLKRQWGSNMKKFGKVALPGGIFLDGQTLYNEAQKEIDKLQERINTDWAMLTPFEIG